MTRNGDDDNGSMGMMPVDQMQDEEYKEEFRSVG
jgi:hypothetical protein